MKRPRKAASRRPFSLALAAAWALGLAAPAPWALAHGPAHDAIEELSARVEAGTASAQDFLRRGELYRIERDWEAAGRDYDQAAGLDPLLPEVAVCRAALHLDRAEPARARAAIDRFLADHADHPEALRIRAKARIALGKPLEAADDLDRVIAVMPHPTPEPYVERALLLAGSGDSYLALAIDGLDQGIARLGPIVTLEFCAIELEVKAKRFDSALARLDRVASQFERRESLLERRGEILAAAGRRDESRQAFAAALAAIESVPPERRATHASQELEARLRAALEATP